MPEFDWFFYACLASLLNGLQGFQSKTAAEQHNDPYLFTFASSSVSYLIAGAFLFQEIPRFGQWGYFLILTLIGALGFILVGVGKLNALLILPAGTVFTVFRSNVLFVLVILVAFPGLFTVGISPLQMGGVLLVLLGVLILNPVQYWRRSEGKVLKGFGLVLLTAVISSLLYVSQKIAMEDLEISENLFIFSVNLAATCFCLFIIVVRGLPSDVSPSLRNGALSGVYGYIAFWCFLRAVKEGYVALAVPVNSASFVIPIMLSALVYREKITKRMVLAVVFTFAGLVLIKGAF